VSWLPLYHDMGLIACFFLPLILKVPLVAMSPFDWVRQPSMWLDAVSTHRATLSWLPNFAFSFMATAVRDGDLAGIRLDSLRGVVNCSEPVLAASHDAFVQRFADQGMNSERLAASYAMAENTFAVTSAGFGNRPLAQEVDRAAFDQRGAVEPASSGRPFRTLVSSGAPLRETEVSIVDESGLERPENHVGEIRLRSPALMSEYDDNPEATNRALRDGWYWTGDLGYMCEGQLFVTGRKQDLVIVGGKNIYPQDVESVVANVSGVMPGRVVAFGVPREDLGTEQLVVLAESESASDSLRRAIHAAVVEHADLVPGDVQLLPPRTLVKSTAGKLSRSENRRRYLEEWGADLDAPAQNDVVRDVVVAFLPRDIDPSTIVDDTPLLTSGLLDSFATAELLAAIERAAGVTIDTDKGGDIDLETIAGIRRLVEDASAQRPNVSDESEEGHDIPLAYDDPRRWPSPARGGRLRSLYYRVLLRMRGVRVGRRLRVLGPITLEFLGPARNLQIGDDVTLMPGVHLKLREHGRVVIHTGVKLDTATRLVAANDALIEIGEHTSLGAGTIVNAGADVTIGRGTLTAAYCVINASDHRLALAEPIRAQGFDHAPVRIGEDVWLGAGVFVAKGSTVGNGAVISAGAVVSGAIPAHAIAQGRPARVVGSRR
jgi:acetyltransferase-like isoleucine patch superfamily enzyme/acyl carrier protein